MLRNKSKAVPGRYGTVLHDNYKVSRLTMEELLQILAEEIDNFFDRGTSHFDHERFEDTEEKSRENQRVAGLQHGSQ